MSATPGAARVTFLGTGTSHGVPMIGCTCATCLSDDPRDRRLRPSIFVAVAGGPAVLVDTTPDLRQQALTHAIARIDAVLYTHSHADHLMGLDDMRRFNMLQKMPIPAYADARTAADVRRTFHYIFTPVSEPSGGVPQIELHEISGPFNLGTLPVLPVPIFHGAREILGYRFGSFAYLTDCNRIPVQSLPLLQGLETLVLDALRIRPHPTHYSLSEALTVIASLGPRHAYLTHMCHDLPHAATNATLPAGVQLAYDGLTLDIVL